TTVIKDGVNGFIHTDVDYLIEKMQWLLENKTKAHKLGNEARKTVLSRFGIERFVNDWKQVFELAVQKNKLTYEQKNCIY
ncbi:MAG: hypothetical protein M3R72_04995, partial [Bacteroidota bacterium]|nr:hypothetical protein [Bacteroidota bacterium]